MRHALPVWLAVVMLLSFIPLKFKLLLGTTGHWHSAGHYLIFLTTMLLATWYCNALVDQFVRGFSVFLFGLSLEIGEVLLYHNAFEWRDVLIDALGVLTGLAAVKLFRPKSLKTAVSAR